MVMPVFRRFLLLSVVLQCCIACADAPDTAPPESVEVEQKTTTSGTELTQQELELEAPAGASASTDSADDGTALRISLLVEGAYQNERGDDWVDVFERDYTNISVQLATASGMPIAGVKPKVSLVGDSRVMELPESTSGQASDVEGIYEFAVIGGKMGLDRLRVSVDDVMAELWINVISLRSAGYASPDSVEGAVPWTLLTKAKVSYADDGTLLAKFPDEMKAKNGERVKLAGFMIPLEPQRKQHHFVITSSPPSCFFHVPGGPAGAAEVFAEKGVTADDDLIIVEGRLEIREKSPGGSVYYLRDAELVKQ